MSEHTVKDQTFIRKLIEIILANLGNETFGVSQLALKRADRVIELPMYGVNKSLNVVVATGIVLYQIRQDLSLT